MHRRAKLPLPPALFSAGRHISPISRQEKEKFKNRTPRVDFFCLFW